MTKREYFAGVDVGASYVKTVIVDETMTIVGSSTLRSSPPLRKSISEAYETALTSASLSSDNIGHVTATGFGRREVAFARSVRTEITCHSKGAYHYFPRRITIVDIGGQDTKVIKLDKNGRRIGFRMNRKCAAGTGAFLEEIAHKLGLPMDKMNALAADGRTDAPLGSFCTVFATTEMLTRITEGEEMEDLMKSAFESVVRKVIEMERLEGTVVLTGGVVEHNKIILDIIRRHLGTDVLTPPHPQLIGAVGAALIARCSHHG